MRLPLPPPPLSVSLDGKIGDAIGGDKEIRLAPQQRLDNQIVERHGAEHGTSQIAKQDGIEGGQTEGQRDQRFRRVDRQCAGN